jgi:magnesium transporter
MITHGAPAPATVSQNDEAADAERKDSVMRNKSTRTPLVERAVALIETYHEAGETDEAFDALRRETAALVDAAACIEPGRAIDNPILESVRRKVEPMYDHQTSLRLLSAFEHGCSTAPRGASERLMRPLTQHANGDVIGDATQAKAALNDPLSRHLHQHCARILVGMTVSEAIDGLRRDPPHGRILYLYVVDDEGRLVGVVPARRLLLAAAEQPVAELMVRQVVALPAQTTVLEACEFFIQHRFLAFPVVDDRRRLLGVVDVELYTDELSELEDGRVRDELFQLLGVYTSRGQRHSPQGDFRRRFPWLGCNLAAGILAAFLSSLYKDELDRVVALAFFIPVVLNLAESVSSQSVSLALQALHGRSPSWSMVPRRLAGELATGLMLGLAAGAAVGLVGLVWLGQARVALCLLGGIAGGVACAALLGTALPFALRLLRLEPRVAAGPVALAGADVITIVLYLNLARWLLN